MKLTYNQYLDNKNKLKDDAEFGKHKDYRVLIQWSIPDIPQKIIHRGSIEPKEYIIYRKGSNFEREIGRVDINDDNSYLFLDDLELLPNIDYQYKIISVNDAGDSNSKYSKSVRFESVLKQSDCDLLFDDVDTSLRYIGTNNVFKGFPKIIDHDENICKESQVQERTDICQKQIKKINSNYENTYNSELKKCLSNTEPLVLPKTPIKIKNKES